jgi:adenosylcobinamide-GDP ribazoletransferase
MPVPDPTSTINAEPIAISAKLAFLTAVQFLTRIPVPGAMSGTMETYKAALQASVVYFPLVGVLIGFFTATMNWSAGFFWPPLVAAILAVAAEALLTGAFHEDALADAIDALGGGWTREQVLEILKDSRHGTYGVLALVLGVSLRIALISNLSWSMAWLVIPFSAGIGRWSILILMRLLDPITDRHTMVRDVGAKPSLKALFYGALYPIVVLGLVLSIHCSIRTGGYSPLHLLIPLSVGFALAVVSSLLMTWYFARLVQRRVGGVTGDFLGSNCYLVQLVSLLAMQK